MGSAWMQSPNLKLAMFVASAALPMIIADVSSGHVSWATALTVALNCLIAAKAFMTNPNDPVSPPAPLPNSGVPQMKVAGFIVAFAGSLFLLGMSGDAQQPKPQEFVQQVKTQEKYTVAPPVHSAKGVIVSAWSPNHIKHHRGLNKTPRHVLVSAPKFVRPATTAPPLVAMLPPTMSMLGNDQYGDCVTASESWAIEAFSVYCGLPETVITDASAISWAQAGGYLNGADLPTVMADRQTRGIVAADGKAYTAGPYTAVDYSNEQTLQAAIAIGPVNIGIDANALPSGAGNNQGWFAFGGSPGQFGNEDHCVRLGGYGATADLVAKLNAAYNVTITLPANAPANSYLLYTWSTIGLVDHAWIMSTCGEAWSQNPTTVGQTPGPTPTPPPPPTPTPGTLTIKSGSITMSDGSVQTFTNGTAGPGTSGTFTVNASGQIVLTPGSGSIAKKAATPRMDKIEANQKIQAQVNADIITQLRQINEFLSGKIPNKKD